MHSGNRVKSKEPRGEDVRIVFDHPRRHVGRRASRSVGKAAGTLLILIGLLASIGAVPATFAVLALLAGWITSEPLEELAATETVIAWAILTSLATSGLYYGLRLLRDHVGSWLGWRLAKPLGSRLFSQLRKFVTTHRPSLPPSPTP